MVNLSEEIYTRSQHGSNRIVRRDDGRRPGPYTYALVFAAFCAFLPTAILTALSAPSLYLFHRLISAAVRDTTDARRGLVKRGSFWMIRAWVNAYIAIFRRTISLLPGPIMKGDLEEVWRRYRIDPETRPELHAGGLPTDIRRALWLDGRTISGELPAPLGDVAVSERTLVDMALIALQVFLAVFWTIFGIWFVGLALLGASPVQLLQVVPMAALVALSAGLLLSVDAFRYALSKMRSYIGLRTRDLSRWGRRPEVRATADRIFAKMTENARGYFKQDPVLVWGAAGGHSRIRGNVQAPMEGQALASDLQSLYKHCLVLGGTGEGKSTFGFSRIVKFFLSIFGSSALVFDAKAVLYRDVEKMAERLGRKGDVRVIGVERDHAHFDMLDGLSPTEALLLIEACFKKGSADGSNEFWDSSALALLLDFLTVARAYEATPRGLTHVMQTGDRIYSFGWIFSVMQDRRKLGEALAYLSHLFLEEHEVCALIDTEDTRRSINNLKEKVILAAGDKTRDSVKMTLESYLSGLCTVDALRRFAWASDGDCIAVGDIFDGSITCVALSNKEFSGSRICSLLLKTTFYREASLREMRMGSKYCQSRPTLLLVDEAQQLLAVGGNALDDLHFPEIARSTGVAIAIATQVITSFSSRIGRDNTHVLLSNLRNRVFLRSENPDTLEYMQKIAGRQLRAAPGEGPESFDDRIMRAGLRPFEAPYIRDLFHGAASPWNAVLAVLAPLSLLNVPLRGSVSGGYAGLPLRILEGFGVDFNAPSASANEAHAISEAALLESVQLRGGQQVQRPDDDSVDNQDILTDADITSMGQYEAFVVAQRCAAGRSDKILVVHDFT